MSSTEVGYRGELEEGSIVSSCLGVAIASVSSQAKHLMGGLEPLWTSGACSVEEEPDVEQRRARTLQGTSSHHKDPQRGMAPASLIPASHILSKFISWSTLTRTYSKGDSGKCSFYLY